MKFRAILFAAFFLFTPVVAHAQTVFTATTSGSFTVPTGVTSVFVEVWGEGGGTTGGCGGSNCSGGGGGGAYSASTLSVTPADIIPYGTSDGYTYFQSTTTIRAIKGTAGQSAIPSGGLGGAGGAAASGIGDVKYSGGNGGNSPNGSTRGGGGSSGGVSCNGSNASGGTAGTSACTDSFVGTNGGNDTGGRGGGCCDGDILIRITYTEPTPPFSGGGATSTIEQSQQNYVNSVYIFLIAMFGMIWLLRKH